MPIINTFNPSTAVNVTTDEITIPSHNFLPINGIVYSNGGGTSIGGLVEGFKYYIIYVNANTVKLATTEDNARNNIAVDLLSVGSGTLHTISESYVFPNSSAYYDFFRKVRLIGDGLPIEGVQLEAKSVRDTFTIIGGNNINFECDTVDISQAQFTINAPNYQLKFLTGTSDLRLFNDAGFDQNVRFKAGAGVAITHNSLEEIEITSFGVTESDTIQTVTSRGNITNNRIVMNDITVAEIVSTPGIDGVTTSNCVTTNTTSDSITGDGTLDAPVRFSNTVNSSSEPNETVTVTFSVPNPGTLSYAASYIAESAVLTTGTLLLEREDPLNPGTWAPLDSISGTNFRIGYNIQGIYAELSPGVTNYRLIWDWSGNSSFVRLSFGIYFEVEPIAGFEVIATNTASKSLVLGVDDGIVTVRGPSIFTGYIDTQGLRIYQNNIVGTGSNDDIVVDLNGTGALELRATTFNTNETTFNIIDTVATTVNAFGAATTINVGADSGTITIGNPTLVGTQTTQNVYDTVATTVNAFGAATAIDVGASTGTLTINNPTLVGSQTTQNVYDTVATTVNAFGDAATLNIGDNTGTLTLRNPTVVGTETTQNVYDTVATTVNAFGDAATLNIGDNTGTVTLRNPTVVGTETTQNIYDTVATTINAFGDAATLNIGDTTGTVTLRNPTLVGTETTQNIYNTVATTVNAFGAATAIEIGAATGTTNINNNLVVDLDLEVKGGDLTTNQTTFNLLNTTATTINAFGAASTAVIATNATSIQLGNFTLTGNVIDTDDSSGITITPAVEFNSNIRANDISVDQDLTVVADADIGRDLSVGNDVEIQGDILVGQNLIVQGDLTVNGTTVTLNTSTLDVEDLNITVAKGALNSAAADGAGLTVDGAGATLTYASADDSWNFNKLLTSASLQATPIGTVTRAAGNFTTLNANGDVTLGDADTDTITLNSSFVNGTQLKSSKADSNTLSLAAYDVDGTSYTNLLTLTASNTPTLALTSTGVGTINNMSIGATTPSTGKFLTLEVRDTTTAAFDLFFASDSSVALTGDRALTFDVENANRTIALGGNIDLANNFTTAGNFALSFTTTASTSLTLPTTGTLATLAGSESLTNKKLGSLTTNGIVTTGGGDGTLSVTATTGSGSVVLGTSPTISTPSINSITHGNSSSGIDGNVTVEADQHNLFAWIASLSAARTLFISNLTAGRMVTVYLRNTNATGRVITIQASTTTSGHANVNLSPSVSGGASVSVVSLAATSGTAVIRVFNANGNICGSIT
jgi:hypothetical protein